MKMWFFLILNVTIALQHDTTDVAEVGTLDNITQFSNIIYEFFYMRFKFGYYRYGETLPPIDTICREFSVAPETVKNAFRTLRSEGYIDMHGGRLTKALYEEEEETRQDTIHQYFSARYEASTDLYESVGQVFAPILLRGLRQITPDDITLLRQYARQASYSDVLYFLCCILQKFNNPLIMNLFWETAFFVGLFFLRVDAEEEFHDRTGSHAAMENIISCCEEQDWTGLYEALIRFQDTFSRPTLQYLRRYQNTDTRQLPFIWRVYYGRPQICYRLATHVLHSIYIGEYRGQAYLPSYETMAKRYGVSVSTIRRTVNVLNQLGVAESVNGIGTRVFSTPGTGCAPALNSPPIRRNLALFFQAYEMIVYTCECAFGPSLDSLPSGHTEELAGLLEDNLQTNRCEFTFWHLLMCIAIHNPSPGIREIYSKIYSLFLWGYALNAEISDPAEYERLNRNFTETILSALNSRDHEACVATFNRQIEKMSLMLKQYLTEHGISQEELRIPPSARLVPGSE